MPASWRRDATYSWRTALSVPSCTLHVGVVDRDLSQQKQGFPSDSIDYSPSSRVKSGGVGTAPFPEIGPAVLLPLPGVPLPGVPLPGVP